MKLTIDGIGVVIGPNFTQKVEKRLQKFSRILDEDADVSIKFSKQKKEFKAEITIKVRSTYYRAEHRARDLMLAFDGAMDKLDVQIRRQKSRVKNRRTGGPSFVEAYLNAMTEEEIPQVTLEDEEINFVKDKHYTMEPMDPHDAVIKMELLGHNFFVFNNAKTQEINVVYARSDGGYGILSPESDKSAEA